MSDKLNPEKVATVMKTGKILNAQGLAPDTNVKTICQAAGISRKTGYQWGNKLVESSDLKEQALHEQLEQFRSQHEDLKKRFDDVLFENEGCKLAWEIHDLTQKMIVPGGYGRSIDVKKGQYVAVRDIEGGQCGDFWAIDTGDFNHFLSPPHTWVHLGRIQPRIGDELVTNRREPILKIVADDVGWHDMLVPACDRQRYERYYGVKEHRNCHDNFLEAMGHRGWDSRLVPQPFNLFMNTFVESDGTMLIRDPVSKKGDKVAMIAKISLIIVVSACPMDLNPIGGQGITDLQVVVADTEEEIIHC